MTTVDVPAPLVPAAPALPVTAVRRIGLLRWWLASTGLLAAWLVLFVTVLSGIAQHRDQATLYATFREQLAQATAPVSAPVQLGVPVAVLSVPSLGLDRLVVVEGTRATELEEGPGHRPDSVLPGQAGVSVVYGRAASFGGPFAHVPDLPPGTAIHVVTGQGAFTYTVQRTRRAGDAVSPPPAGQGRLTLVTAEGTGRLGRWVPRSTVFVDAVLEKPAAAGRVGVVTDRGELPMAGETGAMMPLVLWLEGLLLVALGLAWAARRWGGRQAWLVGLGPLVAVLWGCSQQVWLLVPNLF